jgi:hypothetical protein
MALVGQWQLQDNAANTTVAATVGSNGTLSSGTTAGITTTGPGGSLTAALAFSTQSVDLGSQAALNIAGDVSVGCWINIASAPASLALVFDGYQASGFAGYGLAINSTGTLRFWNGSSWLDTDSAIPTGQWVHIVATNDGTNTRMYVDDTLVKTSAHSNPAAGTDNKYIAARDGSLNRLTGSLADIRVYDNAISASDVTTWYQEAAGDSVNITSLTANEIFQQSSDTASITVAGTYTGSVTAIEARFDGGTWTEIDSSPTGGTYSGTLAASVGTGSVEVRFSNDTGVTNSISPIHVGDIFLVSGQSNGEGRLGSNQSFSGGDYGSVVFDQDDTTWRTMADPTDPNSTGSQWPLVATLIAAGANRPTGFITTADGSTGLVDSDWDSDGSGATYNTAVSRVTTIDPNGIAANLWDQGESDSQSGISESAYRTHFDALVAGLQTDTSLTFKTISTLVGTHTASSPPSRLDAIRAAQKSAWENNSDVLAGPVSYQRAGTHWTGDTEGATLAGLWWLAIEDALYGGTNGRGPRVTAAVPSGSTVVLTFDRDLDTGDTTYTSTAFTIDNDDGTARAVSSVSRTGTREVTVTADGAIDGTSPTITFASGNTGASATVPKTATIALPATINSVSAVALPAEPFTDYAITAPTISVTSPASTDRRLVGTPEAITWTSSGVSGTVDVLVSTDNGSNFTAVASAETNDGSYDWNPDTVATQAIVRVRSTNDNTVTDDSDAFIVATTSTGGVPTDSPEWNLLRQVATDAGLELTQ